MKAPLLFILVTLFLAFEEYKASPILEYVAKRNPWRVFPPNYNNGPKIDLRNLPFSEVRTRRKYDSYDLFNPDQYEKGSPEWNLAMINYLLDMKKHGQKVLETEATKGTPAEIIGGGEDGKVVCKMEPLNLCYSVDEDGQMHQIGEHRPVRLLRIYK